MTEKEFLNNVGPDILQALSTCWRDALVDVRGQYNNPQHCNRIRSALLTEQASIHGQERLPALGVQCHSEKGQRLFILPDKIVFVFKKLDEGQRAHKNDTDRCGQLFQSLLFDDLTTVVVGMEPDEFWLGESFPVFILRPNWNGFGNAWALNITDGAESSDSNQTKITPIFEATETDQQPIKKPKHKKKHDPNTGESSEEAGPGGSSGK